MLSLPRLDPYRWIFHHAICGSLLRLLSNRVSWCKLKNSRTPANLGKSVHQILSGPNRVGEYKIVCLSITAFEPQIAVIARRRETLALSTLWLVVSWCSFWLLIPTLIISYTLHPNHVDVGLSLQQRRTRSSCERLQSTSVSVTGEKRR